VGGDGTIVYCNARFAEMVGEEHSRVIGSSLYQYMGEHERPLLKSALEAASKGQARIDAELCCREGASVPVFLSISVLPGDRADTAFCVIATDLTQQKHHEKVAAAQALLRESEAKLRVLNETLERQVAERSAVAEARAKQLQALALELTHAEQEERRRLAQVLHDHLQQILVAAQMRLSLLPRAKSTAEAAEFTGDAAGLIRQAIDASRELTIELNPPMLSDRGLGAALEWLGRSMFNRHGLTVQIDAGAEPAGLAENLKSLIFQATRELLFNVVKHSGVKTARVTMEAVGRDMIRVGVEDRGKGFALHDGEEQIDKRFGLFSIRERMALLGGRVEIESEVGRGTRVGLFAPLGPVEAPADAAAQRVAKDDRKKFPTARREPARGEPNVINVVLVDDHKVVREGLARLLSSTAGLRVVGQVDDGRQALEMVRELKPDVVIMDVDMPRMNGVEATRAITAESESRVIGLSMHDHHAKAAAMLAAGAVCYLTKGGAADELIAAVFACARGEMKPG
jgi:PAS domain S-box-containing protein